MALDATQRRAIELLATGKTQTDVAAEIGVKRETVNRWVNHEDEFRASLTKAIEFVGRESLQRMKGRVAKVVSRLDMLVDSDDESIALKAIGMWLQQIKFGEDAAASQAQAQPADVNEVLAYMRWRAEQQAKQPAAAEPQSEGETDAGPRD